MSALQRLQQKLLGQGEDLARDFALTPRALRLHEALKRQAYVRLGFAAVGGALALNTGIATYDPEKLYMGDARHDMLVQRNIYDKHGQLLATKERVNDTKRLMIAAESTTELQELAKDLRGAKSKAQALELDFKLLTEGLSPEEIERIAVDGDTPLVVASGPKPRG